MEDGCLRAKVRMARRISTKCHNSRYPQTLESAPNLDFNGDLVDHHEQGEWAGYCHYTKIGSPTPMRPLYVKISASGIVVQTNPYTDKSQVDKFDILSMEWFCLGELPCSTEEYLARKKQKNLIDFFKDVYKEMNLDSTLHCLAIEFRTTVYSMSERELVLLCPYERG